MNLAVNPYLQYKQNAVQGAGRGELTLMLYDGLVKFIRLALLAVEKKDIKEAHGSLVRAQGIVAYLNETLDHRYEISQNLSALYDYMNRRLVAANVRKDPRIIEEVLGLAVDMRDTWQQAVKLAGDAAVRWD
ncbi:MAG: flagellar export chaperone FliS [Peptococcaceae bacterium]|nr:flagellar export chaperone FliS [Peptococcaceae bacterium]